MGKIADRVMAMLAGGARSADIVAEVARMEAKVEKGEINAKLMEEEFAHFYAVYPNKQGRPDAMKAYKTVRRSSTLDEIMVGLHRYVQSKPLDRPWLNPATFLRQERFRDQPAPVAAPLKGLAAAKQSLREEIENEQRQQRNEGGDPRYVRGLPFLDR